MKKAFILLLAFSMFSSCDYYIINPHSEAVGMIKRSNVKDEGEFTTCYEEKVFPYYYGRHPSGYSQSRDTLKAYFFQHYDNKGYTNVSGYVTVRFIINCKGKIGRFELLQVGTNFKETKFSSNLTDHIVELVAGLKDWKAIKFYGSNFDSYYHITLKIVNGDIVEVLS